MKLLRVGTRGSDLALTQTRWVCARLRTAHPSVEIEEVVIKTHGDVAAEQPLGAGFPADGFVGAIEQALLAARIDFAVHSYKDLPTRATPGLLIAAVSQREAAHDVLLTREPVALDAIPDGFRLGTSSPRRAAQFRRLGNVEIVPLRGNVPTRIEKLSRAGLDGIVLAAAGLNRLGIRHPHAVDLPVDRFVPAPGQGALAVQCREGDDTRERLHAMDHAPSRRAVDAERAFLAGVDAGCHTPVGALATFDGATLRLHGQLFDDAGERMVEGVELGDEPITLGARLAAQLLKRLQA